MAGETNITATGLIAAGYRPIYAGDDYDYTFNIVDGDGDPISLIGATVWFTVKSAVTVPDSSAHLRYSSADATQVELTNPGAGVFVVHFAAEDTNRLDGTWEYDIKIRAAAGNVYHAARGTIEFLSTVTRSH